MIRALSRIKSQPWAITREAMETILDIAARENESPQAVAAKLGRPLENTYDVEDRDGVAVLHISGPLFRYANLFTEISGATSYDLLARDFNRAVNDPRIHAIVLNVDSPGGEANGVSEFADMIYAARGQKPIVAYVGGQASSAAYWIASAADEVVADETAILGSIGAVWSFMDSREAEAKAGRKRFDIVSSQSPDKRLDPATDDGRGKLQALVDSLADVFIDKVARNRGVSRETVLNDFGRGGVFVGQAAVNAGLADRLGSFEGVIEELQGRARGTVGAIAAAGGKNQEVQMDNSNGAPAADPKPVNLTASQVVAQYPEAAAEIRAGGVDEGRQAERERIRAILASEEATDRAELANHLAFETDMAADAAVAMLAKAPKAAKATAFNQLDAVMRREGNPNVGADADSDAGKDPAAQLINTAKAMGLA